jgi:hypothetical protein
MSVGHATPAQIELYVLDALSPREAPGFEAHVAACARCAEALATEAAYELRLGRLWPRARRPLAEVIPLRPRHRAPDATEPARAGRGGGRARREARAFVAARGQLGGAAAAVLAVLFAGWWSSGPAAETSAGGSTVASALAGGEFCGPAYGSPRGGAGGLCAARAVSGSPEGPAAPACWAMCASPIARLAAGLVCAGPSSPTCGRP